MIQRVICACQSGRMENGRWAIVSRGRLRAGPDISRALRRCARLSLEVLPACGAGRPHRVCIFSSDNWKRVRCSKSKTLMRAARVASRTGDAALPRRTRVRMTTTGRRDRRPDPARGSNYCAEQNDKVMRASASATTSSTVRLCDAILSARAGAQGGAQLTTAIREELLGETRAGFHALIRTGGEQRLRDFLLWECAYGELVFTDSDVWPDFQQLVTWCARGPRGKSRVHLRNGLVQHPCWN